MTKENEFIYDKMSNNYDCLMNVMGAIYDGKELKNEELLEVLGQIANGMLDIQLNHVMVNGNADSQSLLFGQINAKRETLDNGLLSSKRKSAR